ncbi:uncharacterized protein LOC132191447 [Corylus avellana]|uniref:uncharacterized protein LOC132191447 n=1 Tax=Corylus avellana TaxID=13451 RepID=UPI00286AE3A4|nr:uncharacterized protein LOC132191447 [Corylus avellana]
MVTADENVWDEFVKAHPDMLSYRARVVPHYNELCIICGHAIADGRYSLSCFDIDFDNEETTNVKTPPSDDHSKIDWSQTMDQFFVELMLDQVHKGNKIGHTFKKKAWAGMVTSFNTKFGFHCGGVVLKNRYNILRRHHSSIKILLTQNGFCWDETQQKVVADELLWNKYIKAHHNFRMYRNKVMPYYSDMRIICGDEATTMKNNTPYCKSHLQEETHGKKNMNGKALIISDTDLAADNAGKEALHSCGDKKKNHKSRKNSGGDKKKHHSISDGDKNIASEQQKRLQPEMCKQTFQQSKRAKRIHDGMADALREMAAVVTSLTRKTKKESSILMEGVVDVLQAMPDMDDNLLLDACDFLEDEKKGRMFLALDASLQKKWLMRKLRQQ